MFFSHLLLFSCSVCVCDFFRNFCMTCQRHAHSFFVCCHSVLHVASPLVSFFFLRLHELKRRWPVRAVHSCSVLLAGTLLRDDFANDTFSENQVSTELIYSTVCVHRHYATFCVRARTRRLPGWRSAGPALIVRAWTRCRWTSSSTVTWMTARCAYLFAALIHRSDAPSYWVH